MIDRLLSNRDQAPEGAVKARVLNLMSLVTAAVIVLYVLVATITTPGQITAGGGSALAGAFVLCLACFWLNRTGRARLAAYLLFAGLFIGIGFYATDPGNKILDLAILPALYILIVVPASYVLYPWAGVLITLLAALYVAGLFTLAPPPAYLAYDDQASFWSNVGLGFALAFILSALAWIFGQGIDRALQQAQAHNRELQQVAAELEAQRRLQAETGRRISEVAERLAEYSARQARGANRQAAAVAQVSTSIEELEGSAREIAHSARLVDRAARQTLAGAEEGEEAIGQNCQAMERIQANAQKGVDEATGLDEHLKQVSRVATIMSDIASQIQLVAFNATLEAAEAGASGRRFGVVAAEVKDLASDSLQQAKQVAQIVRQVQEAGGSVIALSGEQVAAVGSGAEMMTRSRAANEAIISSAAGMAELAGQIQQTTAQQQVASEQVAASVSEIRTVVDRWVVSSYQMDELVASLQALAGQLA